MVEPIIAHVKQNDDGSWDKPQLLEDHLRGAAKLAREFASKFDSADWGGILGLAHDLGKGRNNWQEYLRTKSGFDQTAHLENSPGKIRHSIHGAKILEELYKGATGRFLGYCVAGHHAGLPDWSGAMGAGASDLEFQLAQTEDHDEVPMEF